jgi:hypothetical protein
MVAWGYGAFENVNAMEWVDDLDDYDDTSIIYEALEKAIEYYNAGEIDLLEEPFGSEALAAIEIIVAFFEKSCINLPSEVSTWIKNQTQPSYDLINFSLKALEAIQYNSEIRKFWEDNEKLEIWYEEILQLKKRLKSIKTLKLHNRNF